ncbi:DNA glycosylase AlkZ-like family protein [Roseateles koreensis]|uniref:Crosslink repair DNA glycosylase YcaQ family protein n=1 Tax=Roseateles koreensis TaxID=2987526 RepID=A0ABT5KP07_9BURK|nr:crosslink repair DNA glycosylase YcaQ family protein [Roseateles koreensis]MDC8784629.1 crosslink repair DNA glycosylase YcaQ family protein [Roseateles koreensis]
MAKSSPDLASLRRYAIARSLFKPTHLPGAIRRLGFVQADPMRAPARAQDLILTWRVKNYRAGDLEQRYPQLDIEEDCFVNYGFLPRESLALMHPRTPKRTWDAKTRQRADELLAWVQTQPQPVHPRQVQQVFDHGQVRRYWGGQTNAVTHLLDGMHYRGMLRVARRDKGTRVYAATAHPEADDSPAARQQRATALLDQVIHLYAPLPARTLGQLVSLLAYGAPHLRAEVRAALAHARQRYGHALIEGQTWFWPAGESPASRSHRPDTQLRLLAPFDPVVWDRRRFEMFWGWTYKFEAYTPASQRKMGHYALPMLWGEDMLGWANLRVVEGRLEHELGFAKPPPQGPQFEIALQQCLAHMSEFLGLD